MSEDTIGQITPGSTLASAREVSNLTQRDIADALNLSIAVVEAIETGDQDRLPSGVFTKGYIRAYAKLLDLDPEPLVGGLSAEELVNRQPQVRAKTRVAPIQLPLSAFVGAVLCLVLLLVWAAWPSSDEVAAPTDAAVNVLAGTVEKLLAPGIEAGPSEPVAAVQDADEVIAAEGTLATLTVQASDVTDAVADRIGVTETQDQTAIGEPDSEGFRALTAAGDQRLELEFLEECWVEIKDAEGGTLFADLGRPGRAFKFQGQGPFHVLLGYAPGALVSFNEKSIALAPHTRNNVASVVLGQ
jgi:cytoskeleton protein RodZ